MEQLWDSNFFEWYCFFLSKNNFKKSSAAHAQQGVVDATAANKGNGSGVGSQASPRASQWRPAQNVAGDVGAAARSGGAGEAMRAPRLLHSEHQFLILKNIGLEKELKRWKVEVNAKRRKKLLNFLFYFYICFF